MFSGKWGRQLGPMLVCGLLWATSAGAELRAVDPYARSTPPGMENSAAYLTLHNEGQSDRRLVTVGSPVAARVEMHTHLHENGVMRMREVDHIEVPAGGSVALEPGGLHIMLIRLTRSLAPGDVVPLALEFDDGQQLELEAEVRHPGGRHRHHHH